MALVEPYNGPNNAILTLHLPAYIRRRRWACDEKGRPAQAVGAKRESQATKAAGRAPSQRSPGAKEGFRAMSPYMHTYIHTHTVLSRLSTRMHVGS